MELADGSPVWELVVRELWPARNKHIHAGEPVAAHAAARAIEAIDVLLADVVASLVHKLELSWPATPWHDVKFVNASRTSGRRQTFDRRSPFD